MNRKAPVYGVTKCPGCRKLLDDGTGRKLADRQVEEYGFGTSSSGFTYRHIHSHTVTQKWHADCLAKFFHEFEVSQLTLAVSMAKDKLATTQDIAAAAGATSNKWVEKAEAEVAEAEAALSTFLKEHPHAES